MIDSIEIENYRCFDRVELKGCRRVNVIVGDNGSGKTALLEALFMSSAPNPEIATRFRQWRGVDAAPIQGTHLQIEDALFGELFHALDKRRQVYIQTRGSREDSRSLRIVYRVRERWVDIRAPSGKKKSEKNRPAPITFTWVGPDMQRRTFPLNMTNEGKIVIPVLTDVPVEMAYFGSNLTYGSLETVSRFSTLSKAGKEREVTKYLTEHFGVESFSIETSIGSPILFAKMEGIPEKVPLNVASGGLNRLTPIICSILNHPKGAILIDEIEDGFYYKKMESIWEILLKLADENGVQLFITTHSLECLTAAAKVAEKNPEQFALIRATHSDGKSSLELTEGEDFVATVEAGFDPRSQ